jgi:hypothetical protein
MIGVCENDRDVCRSGYGCECMGLLYLSQDMGVSVWADCIYVRIGVCVYGLAVSTSE